MRPTLYAFLLGLLLLCCVPLVHASHILGGEVTYTQLSSLTYRIRLVLYRSCAGVTLPATATVGVMQNGAAPGVNVTLAMVGSPSEVSNCAGVSTQCTNPNSIYPGVERAIYEGVYTFAQVGIPFVIRYATCCRAPDVMNLQNPSASGMSVSASLVAGISQSSPVFDPFTTPFLCNGSPSAMDFHATDPDNDSLTYSLVPSNDDQGNAIPISAGYTVGTPLGPFAVGQSLDLQGLLTFTPTATQVVTVAVLVREWRNGGLIGTSVRELPGIVVNCLATCGTNVLQGNVYADNNNDCVKNAGDHDISGWMVRLDPGPYFTPTDPLGNYQFAVDSGSYTVSVVTPSNGYWQVACPNSGNYSVTFPSQGDSSMNNDFGVATVIHCPDMWVDIGTTLIRPCSLSHYNVQYCNNGTDTAFSAYVTIDLDSAMTYSSSSIPVGSSSGNSYTFNLGNLAPGQCGLFTLSVLVDCNLNLTGSTMCVDAHIYPDSICGPVNSAWDRSSVSVTGACVGNQVCFDVVNTGSPVNGNMTGPTPWRLYENGILILSGSLQLCGGCDTTLCFTANGNTLRLEVDQRPGHPGNSHPNASVELCGTPGTAVGLINALPPDDADAFVDIHCLQVVNGYDPNRKRVVPSGVTEQHHYIDSSAALTYTIDFQNLGTGSAYDVRIKDFIDPRLDLASLVMGSASHPYTYQVNAGRELVVFFQNIQLEPANVDEAGSMGFVQYRIQQVPGNTLGDQIHNSAQIYFDFNPPILTDTTMNTVGWPDLVGAEQAPFALGASVVLYPNPNRGQAWLRVEGLPFGTPVAWRLLNLAGQTVMEGSATVGADISIGNGNLARGAYIYQLHSEGNLIGAGRHVVH